MFLEIVIVLGIICSLIYCIEKWLRTSYYLTEEQKKYAKDTKVRFEVRFIPKRHLRSRRKMETPAGRIQLLDC